MNMIERLVRMGSNGLAYLGGVFLLLMMIQIVVDVIMRGVFNSPIEGNLEVVSVYYMVGVVFLPLAMVELRHEHISAELFVVMLPHRLQSFIYAACCVIALVFFAVLGWQTLLDAINATEINEMLMGSIFVVIWPSRWMLPVGFFMIACCIALHMWQALMDPDNFRPSLKDADAAPEIKV